jgi:hypothetical protein
MKSLLRAAPATTLVVAAALPAGAEASWPDLNGRVSLTQRVPAGAVRANRDIFAYSLGADAAAGRWRLTFDDDNEEQSSWSPEGPWIAYKRLENLWISCWDGTGNKPLTNYPNALKSTQPSWSPDVTAGHRRAPPTQPRPSPQGHPLAIGRTQNPHQAHQHRRALPQLQDAARRARHPHPQHDPPPRRTESPRTASSLGSLDSNQN